MKKKKDERERENDAKKNKNIEEETTRHKIDIKTNLCLACFIFSVFLISLLLAERLSISLTT
jgi:hypothetical protein